MLNIKFPKKCMWCTFYMVKLFFFFFLKTAGVRLDEQEMHKVS